MTQEFSSAMTSINKEKLPAIFNKINWEKVHKLSPNTFPKVLDYGAGRFINHIRNFVNLQNCLYYPYDINWITDTQNESSLNCKPNIIICSNLLNVIKENQNVYNIVFTLLDYNVPIAIQIYEGDKSGVGRQTKKDCWQRNQTKDYYCLHHTLKTYHGFITNDASILL